MRISSTHCTIAVSGGRRVMKNKLFLLCLMFWTSELMASSEEIDLTKFGYQVLDTDEEDEKAQPVSAPSTPFMRTRSLPISIPRKPSSRALLTPPFDHRPTQRELGLTEENRGDSAMSTKTVKDGEFFKEFDSETPQFFYHKGLTFEEFSALDLLTVRSHYLNELHFYKIESELQIKSKKNKILHILKGKEITFNQMPSSLIFTDPGKLMSAVVRNQMNVVFKRGPYQADYMLFKIRLFTKAIEDIEVSIDLLFPIRFQYLEADPTKELQVSLF